MTLKKTSRRTRPIQTRPGFTLVEILVSITIIVVLAALVFTMTGKIRTKAQQTNAVSAMRQVGLANVSYYTENNGNLNTIRDSPGEKGAYEAKGGRWVGDSFMGRMQPYLFPGNETTNQPLLGKQIIASLKDLLGTSDIKTMAGSIFSGVVTTSDGSAINNPFAINNVLRPKWGPLNPPSSVSRFGDPSTILYLTFGRYYFKPEHIKTYKPLPAQGDNFPIYYLPDRKGIFAFLDGHVELLSPPIEERRLGEKPAQ